MQARRAPSKALADGGVFSFGAKADNSQQRDSLMRFHFNLADGKSVADKGNQDLDDAVQASEVAEEMAGKLLRERPSLAQKGYAIVVNDEEGAEIYRAKLSGRA